MKNFFQHIKYKYNTETSSLLKQYSRQLDKLAKSMERAEFLQNCRQCGITPTHIKNSTQRLEQLFKSTTAINEVTKIETNLHAKLLNVEIRDTHINTKTLQRDIRNIERDITYTLNETELIRFKKEQWYKYNNLREKTNKIHQTKINKLKSDKFRKYNFTFNEDWFINYTSVNFNLESKWLLSLGNKFALPVNNKNFSPIPLIADIEQWVQTIKDDTEKEITRSKIANRITQYKRNLRNNDKEKFILNIYEETKQFLKEHEDKIIITSADKGNKTVIMYKEEYKKKMEKLLDDKTTYKTIREDPTAKLQRMNNNIITELFKNNHISRFEKLKLTTHAAAAPELYGLPKIHKEDLPLRPISSSLKVPCYSLAKHIGSVLKNLVSPTYNLKNSSQLKEKIDQITLDNNEIIVSLDVVSLFTNIPIHLAIKNIMNKWETLKNFTTITRPMFLKLLRFCLEDNNYFTFNSKFYHQTYGMPMGNPLSPTIADIVLDTLLDNVIEELKLANVNIKFISKYVDDLFAVIKQDDEEIIMKTLNAYHNKINFTIEKENNQKLPYLDMQIIKDNERLKTNWYTKSTASGRLINYHSTQPTQMKTNTAKNLVKKVLQLSDDKFKNENINKVRKILTMNSYPPFIINNIINKTLSTEKHESDKQKNENNFYSVPYIPKLTETTTLKSIVHDDKAVIAHRSNVTLRHLFTNKKTKINTTKMDNVVYEIKCGGKEGETCNKLYIGTTKRMLGVRLAEHEADIRKGKETTALAQHIKDSGHKANFENVKILDKEKNEQKRFTIESLRIQEKIKNTLNTKEDQDQIKLQYSIALV